MHQSRKEMDNGIDRKAWLGVLARSRTEDLDRFVDSVPVLPDVVELRPPETGMIMVRGRTGGTGTPFNLGEMTVTRCSVRSLAGHEGHAMVQGRRPSHARRAASLDAHLQDAALYALLIRNVIAPLMAIETGERQKRQHEAEKTKVDFFTLVRGEDEAQS